MGPLKMSCHVIKLLKQKKKSVHSLSWYAQKSNTSRRAGGELKREVEHD